MSDIAHALCVARQQVQAAGAGAGALSMLQSLEDELAYLVNSMLRFIQANLGETLSRLLNDLWNRVRNFLNSLFGAGKFWLLLLLGGAIVLASGAHEAGGKRKAA